MSNFRRYQPIQQPRSDYAKRVIISLIVPDARHSAANQGGLLFGATDPTHWFWDLVWEFGVGFQVGHQSMAGALEGMHKCSSVLNASRDSLSLVDALDGVLAANCCTSLCFCVTINRFMLWLYTIV